MTDEGVKALLLSTEPEVRYFTGFLTPFWQSPTRPWFVVVPREGRPIAVIPNGIDLALFDQDEGIDIHERFGVPRDRITVFFANRLENRKGIHIVRDLLVETLERHPDVCFVIAGADLDEVVPLDEDHPLRVGAPADRGGPAPYVLVRDRLDALILRSVYYDLVDRGGNGEGKHAADFGVWSRGAFFVLGERLDRA